MTSKRKFYRTVFKVEVLSEEPIEDASLNCIAYQIQEGEWVGSIERGDYEEVDAVRMVKLLVEHQSWPGFFQLTENGEDNGG